MTADAQQLPQPRFVASILPGLIGAGGLAVYLLTLNRWISLLSLGTVARTSGWLWRPQLDRPLTAALLCPFRLLPEPWIPLVLNILTAACAGWVLLLLARSVALLHHDLVRDEPFPINQAPLILSIPTAWVPPLLAAMLCGLQLSFWEHATSASGEMIDLLLFAWVIRCLLEFRQDQEQRWLSLAAFLYGAGMSNNWALIGFFPLFLVAILRVKGYGPFREYRFLLRMSAWGLGGLSLYLFLPAVQSLSGEGQVTFWMALKANLKSQLEALGSLSSPRFRILAVALSLPILVLSIRWKSHTIQYGDDSPLGVFLSRTTAHALHGLFLLTSLWIDLDPAISPRILDLGTPMLAYYYLSSLVFGYCAGYFLLFESATGEARPFIPLPAWRRFIAELRRRAPRLVHGAVLALVCALPLALLWRNLGQILATNAPALRQFARDLYADLPAGKSVVLSDEPAELLLLRAETSAHTRVKDPVLLDAPSLAAAQYHRFIARQFTRRWPASSNTNRGDFIGPGKVLSLVESFATREPLLYLHPSPGPVFELFTSQPIGCLNQLAPRSPPGAPASLPAWSLLERQGQDVNAPINSASFSANEQLWQRRWEERLQSLAELTKEQRRNPPGMARWLLDRLHLASQGNATVSFVGAAYSWRLNYWGVQLQHLGRGREALTWFQRAVELNPQNLSAHINREYAERRQRGEPSRLKVVSIENEFSDLFASYGNWRGVLRVNGPVDEPSFLLRTGRWLLVGGNSRQATRAFARCAELAPDWNAPRLWLASSLIQLREFAAALESSDAISEATMAQDGPGLSRLLACRSTALQGLGRTNEAAAAIENFLNQHGSRNEVLSIAAELYSQDAQFGRELTMLDELLKREINRPDLLARKGLAQMQLGNYDGAITTLTLALSGSPRNEDIRLLRAVAYLGAGRLDAAREDYQELLNSGANPRNALFGLGTVAWRKQDTNLAVQHYRDFLSNGVFQTRQDQLAVERLKELQAPPR